MASDYSELRKLAEEATPGAWEADEWRSGDLWGVHHGDETTIYHQQADAEYIAAANPQVVIGLLDRIAELEARVPKPESYPAPTFDEMTS